MSNTPTEHALNAQYQVFMHQQPVAPLDIWQPKVSVDTASEQTANGSEEATEQVEIPEPNIQFLYPQSAPAPKKALITSLYSVFAIRNADELDAFLTQHHLRHSKYLSKSLQQQLLDIDFSKSVLVIMSKPDLSRVVIEHAEIDQEELSELQQALLYTELQQVNSNDEVLRLRANMSYSGNAETLDQLIQSDQKWDTDFYIIPTRKKTKLSISFPQKGLMDHYNLSVSSTKSPA